MEQKKIAVMIYPYFSLQEVTCLTAALTIWFEREVEIFASSKDPVRSEDGFQVVAAKTFDEFKPEEVAALVLPGILNPIPALFDEKNIAFLRSLKGGDLVLAAISSAPILLAKAGLLGERKFTCGLFTELIDRLDFIPKENFTPVPLIRDGNLITAVGYAFREFAVETLKAIGVDTPDTIYSGIEPQDWETEQCFEMGEEHYKEFMAEYNSYL